MWVNRLLAGKYIAARGHGLAQESMDDQSGEVVEYDHVPGATEPHAIQVPVIPQYAYQETEQNKKSLNEIFGLSDVSRGQLPSAGIPAVGMQLLLEQDETRIGVEIEQHEHAFAKVGMLMLKNAAANFKTSRNLVERGVNNDINLRKYSGEDLPQRPEVRVVRGSTIPTSTSMRRQEILNTMQMGLLGNPADPQVQEKVLSMLEFGDNAGLWEDSALDSAQAKREVDALQAGEMPPIHLYDNHPFLIKKLNNFRKSDKAVELGPEIQMLVEQAIDIHGKMALKLSNPQVDNMKANVEDGLTPDGQPLMDNMQHPMDAAAPGIAPPEELAQNEQQPMQGA